MKSTTDGQLWSLLLLGVLALGVVSACGDEPKEQNTGCTSDRECAQGAYCLPSLGTCHECLDDSHCEGGACIGLTCVAADPDMGNNNGEDEPDMDVPDGDVPDASDMGDVPPDGEDGGDVPPDLVGESCDPECPGIQRCNEETERCEERALCLSDVDCIGARVCFRSECTSPNDALSNGGCVDDASCVNQGQRLFCDLGTHECAPLGLCRDGNECPGELACTGDGLCVECISSAQCSGGLVCDDTPGANYCAEPQGCNGDADCLGDRTCDEGACVEPDCEDDEFEDGAGNDKCSDAAALGEGRWELTICGDNCDWFAVEVEEGDGLVARVLHDPELGDLDLELYQGACGGDGPERIGRSATEGHAEVVRIARSFEHTTYRLRVCPFVQPGDDGTNAYQLDTVIVPDGFCVDDVYDENASNDTAARASNISVTNRPFSFESDGLQVCPGSVDWYRIELRPGDFLTVQTSFLHRFGDLRLELYEGLPGEGASPVAVSDGADDTEIVSLVTERGGEFYIFIGGEDEVQNQYDLSVQIGAGCADAFEPNGDANNTSQTATSLDGFLPAEFVGLRLCEDDEDWFSIDVPDGMGAVVVARYDENLGVDMNADVHREGMPPTPTVGSAGTLAVVAEAPEGGGEVQVRLFRDTEADIIYSLSVELRPLDEICQDPHARGNDTFGDAYDADFGVREYLGTICPGVTQYFGYSVPEGHLMYAELLNVSEQGALEVEILSANQQSLAEGQVGPFGPVATYSAQDDIDVVVAVSGATQQSAAGYLLQAYSHPDEQGCGDDAFESAMGNDNDIWEDARLISGGTWIRNLVGCPGDADWYKFFLIAGSNLSVTIQAHTPMMGALQGRVVDVDGPDFGRVAAEGTSQNGTVTLNVSAFDVLVGGHWSVEVTSAIGEPVFYDLRVVAN